MAEADRDGRIAQALGDRHACLSMDMHESIRGADERLEQVLPEPPRGDGPCQECGRAYPAWFAPHEVWNLVMGGPGATDDPGGLLCPTCFLIRADAVTPQRVWHVTYPPGPPHDRCCGRGPRPCIGCPDVVLPPASPTQPAANQEAGA